MYVLYGAGTAKHFIFLPDTWFPTACCGKRQRTYGRVLYLKPRSDILYRLFMIQRVYTQHWKPSRMIISYFEFPNRCHRLVFKATATFPPTHRSLCHKTTHKLTSTPCCIVLVKYLSQCFLIGVPITTITPDFMPQPLHRFCFWLNRQALRGHIEILSGAYFEFSKALLYTGPQIGEPEKKTIFTRMTIWVKLWLILGQCSIVGSCRSALPQHCLLYHETSWKLLYKFTSMSLLLVHFSDIEQRGTHQVWRALQTKIPWLCSKIAFHRS